jgi:hypothetical protein
MNGRVLENLRSFVRSNIFDSVGVEAEVERYRNFWKPSQVTTLLLAESRVHTSAHDFDHSWRYKELGGRFVRFVYCLAYGENNVFEKHHCPNNNDQGTRPFWEILYSCLHRVSSNYDFESLRKSKTDWNDRVEGKITLLENLPERGIWLADASPLAINMLKSDTKIDIMQEAWKSYTRNLIERLAAHRLKRIGIIGKTVDRAIGTDVNQLGLRVKVFGQPRYKTEEERWKSFSDYYEFCRGRL